MSVLILQAMLVNFSWSSYTDPNGRELIIYGSSSALDTSVVTAAVVVNNISPKDTTVAVALTPGDYWSYMRARGHTLYSGHSNIIYYTIPEPTEVSLDSVLNVRLEWELD